MKRIVENVGTQTSHAVKNTTMPATRRHMATLSIGYLEKSSAENTQKHPQVVQRDIRGNIISENKRAGLTHAENLNPTHEKKLPKVIEKYAVGLDIKQEKMQFCYHFDAWYKQHELLKFKEDANLTNYMNADPSIKAKVTAKFAEVRAQTHREETQKIQAESEKMLKALEKKIEKTE